MSLGSIPRRKAFSEDQFIGDLMGLCARQRLESGEPLDLLHFDSYLASNDKFRSQLFTLCTAISHMAESDLTGGQLLVLIARALGAPKGSDGDTQVPGGMGSGFLSGYEAWSNRDLSEPIPWPPARNVSARDNAETVSESDSLLSEPAAPRVRAPGQRTVQEALEIARTRYPADLPERGPSPLGVDLNELTVNDLTRLTAEIEQRMRLLKPVAREQREPERVVHSAPRAEAAEAVPLKVIIPLTKAAPSASPDFSEAPRVVVGGVDLGGLDKPPVSPSFAARDAAFLDRHPYLKPGRPAPPEFRLADYEHLAPVFPGTLTPVESTAPIEQPGGVPARPAPKPRPRAAPRQGVRVQSAAARRGGHRIQVKLLLARLALIFLVVIGTPLVGLVIYRAIHSGDVVYRDLQPAVRPAGDSAAPGPDGSVAAPSVPAAAPRDQQPAVTSLHARVNRGKKARPATRDGEAGNVQSPDSPSVQSPPPQ